MGHLVPSSQPRPNLVPDEAPTTSSPRPPLKGRGTGRGTGEVDHGTTSSQTEEAQS